MKLSFLNFLKVSDIFVCIVIAGLFLYGSIRARNGLTELQLSLPTLEKELRELEQQNIQLQYAIDGFESPLHLMELLRKPEYGHLKFPHLGEVVLLSPYKEGEDVS